jgi:transglutaminase-like putative cysteine protease
MTSRLRIHHRSLYTYNAAVSASFNEARLTPSVTAWQQPLESRVRVDEATWQHVYTDYWGTQVQVFEAHRPHRELRIDATSVVEVDGTRVPHGDTDVSWDQLAAEPVRNEFGEYLVQTPATATDPELAAVAEELAARFGPHETALALCSQVHDAMSYVPGSTGVQTVASEAWSARTGVCQDYVHVVVGALRQIGVPARYVSGYLHPRASAGIGDVVGGESHAWVEWWTDGWSGHDPTNDIAIGERHVLVGHGRDYNDVPPIKGIVAGGSGSTLNVLVESMRLA